MEYKNLKYFGIEKLKHKFITILLIEMNLKLLKNEARDGAGGGDMQQINGKLEADPEFFDRIKADAKKVFTSEQAAEKKKAMEVC